ncbi:hypothetical protein FUAX_55210 (plasmid) [Fulvitalea axinellae]|uniref:Uncharacterized protein n=2 Tax=Fulvitalea axinellae TaxID=1182444 RepID=A0AAU9D3D1_9BACT|nr:hypothetical protein FUAX_55210 [Fulvitalea axinellae]
MALLGWWSGMRTGFAFAKALGGVSRASRLRAEGGWRPESPELAEGVAGLVCPFPEYCGGTDKHEATYLPEAFHCNRRCPTDYAGEPNSGAGWAGGGAVWSDRPVATVGAEGQGNVMPTGHRNRGKRREEEGPESGKRDGLERKGGGQAGTWM